MGVLGRPSGKEDRGSRTMDEDQQQCGNGTKMDEASDVRRGVGGETDSDDEHDEHDKAGYPRKEKDESDNEAGERNAEDDVEILVTKPEDDVRPAQHQQGSKVAKSRPEIALSSGKKEPIS